MLIELILMWILGGIFFAIVLDVKNRHDTTVGSIVFGGILGIVIMFIGFLAMTDTFDATVLKRKDNNGN